VTSSLTLGLGFKRLTRSHEEPKMKSLKAIFVVTALSVSSLAMAEGGADRAFARMEQARQALEADRVAQQQKGDTPVAGDQGKQLKHANC
jgi:hypothetical protein